VSNSGESNSIVAAGSVITQGTLVKSGSIYAGSPAKLIKEISQELIEGQINRIANSYLMYSSWYKE
jgi:carbonic anhydrase/acetyltransferase-like protein (isoleucine patch superfamily)